MTAAVLPMRALALSSASAFDFFRTSTENRASSLSMCLAQFWHSQIPFDGALRSSGKRPGSYRGPPGDLAVMWAATPTFTALSGSSWRPLVGARHSGFEQGLAARE